MFGVLLWSPSILRDYFIISITCYLFENFKKLNGKLINLEDKVNFNI